MKLFLKEFSLEKDKKCFYDYMEFYDGNATDEQRMITHRMCGTQGPRTFESSGQMLSVVFNSDKSETFKGFRAEWHTEQRSNTIMFLFGSFLTT